MWYSASLSWHSDYTLLFAARQMMKTGHLCQSVSPRWGEHAGNRVLPETAWRGDCRRASLWSSERHHASIPESGDQRCPSHRSPPASAASNLRYNERRKRGGGWGEGGGEAWEADKESQTVRQIIINQRIKLSCILLGNEVSTNIWVEMPLTHR